MDFSENNFTCGYAYVRRIILTILSFIGFPIEPSSKLLAT